MQHEFITAVLDGTLKVADVDPSLQWGLLGGAVGGLGSAIKSVASGEDTEAGLRHAALMGLLGAGVGAGVSGGARLLGAGNTSPGDALLGSSKKNMPSVAGSAGVGAMGALGLGGLSEARQQHFRNKAIGDMMYAGGAKTLLEDAGGKDGKDGKKKKKGPKKPGAEQKDIEEFLKKFRASKAVRAGRKAAPNQELPGFVDRLLGRTNYSTEGLKAIRESIAKHEGAGKSQKALHLRGALKELLQGEKVMKFAPAERTYVDPALRALRSPKGLLTAGAGIGLAHLGISNLIHRLKKD